LIDFRYHVVSIIAVFLALALGLFVGSTSLQDAVVHTINSKADRVSHQNDALRAQVSTLRDDVKNGQNFDKALLPYAVTGRLSGQLVAVVSAPGTSDSLRKQVLATLDDAGATVSADVRLQDTLVNPSQDGFLTALTQRVTIPGHDEPPDATGAQRAASQLATVLGVRPSVHGVAPTTIDTVLSAYTTGKLVSINSKDGSVRPGTLALVLTGPPPPPTADPKSVQAQQDFVLGLLRDLDHTALGAVLAAPTPPQGAAGDMTAAAADAGDLTKQASTVTGADTPAGLIATVFALAGQVDGVGGRYGPGAQASPLPTTSNAP